MRILLQNLQHNLNIIYVLQDKYKSSNFIFKSSFVEPIVIIVKLNYSKVIARITKIATTAIVPHRTNLVNPFQVSL